MRNAEELPPSTRAPWCEAPMSPDYKPIWDPIRVTTRPTGQRTLAVDARVDRYGKRGVLQVRYIPATEMQALMESAPHVAVERSLDETAAIRDRILDTIEALDDNHRSVFEAVAFQGLSIRQAAIELGLSKSMVFRRYQQARLLLQTELIDLVDSSSVHGGKATSQLEDLI